MARTSARVDDLEEGRLPPVCAMTGDPAEEYVRITFTSTPGWTWILLLFGILPFLIARAFSKTRVVGLVPMSDAALRRARSFNWIVGGLFGVGALILVLGMASDLSALAVAGTTAIAAAALIAMIGWAFVWPAGRVAGDVVSFSSVDPRFAQEVDRWYGDV